MRRSIRKLWRVLTGRRLKDSRARREREDELIKEALVSTKEKKVREMEERLERESDPKRKENLRAAVVQQRARLTEAQQVLRGLGL